MQKNVALLRFALPLLLVAVTAAVFLWPEQQETTSAAPAPREPAQPASASEAAVPVQPVVMQRTAARSVSFDDLIFDIEADEPYDPEMLTDSIEALNGVEMKIRGYMLPTYRADGIDEFVLVRDDQVCCFGPGAKICHNMQVYMVGDATASYTTRVVEVEGRFSLQNWVGDDGVVYSCYRIDATRVRHL